MADNEIIWKEIKRTLFGLPWSFTVYKLTKEKLMVTTGFLSKHEEETRLYRVMDLALNRTLGQRMFGLGTIHVISADKSTPEFDIAGIKDSEKIKEMLSDMVEEERVRKRVSGREYMVDHDDDDDDDDDR